MRVLGEPELFAWQIAVMLGCTNAHVRKLIRQNKLTATKSPKGRWRITPASLRTYLKWRAKVHGTALGKVVAGMPDYDKWYPPTKD